MKDNLQHSYRSSTNGCSSRDRGIDISGRAALLDTGNDAIEESCTLAKTIDVVRVAATQVGLFEARVNAD
jgi:hypothetical protein